MRIVDIITKKRDGQTLTAEEIHFFIHEYTEGRLPDYQASALLMAIYFRGMTAEECANLTQAMVDSGEIVDLSSIEGIKIDKHSTGGVGDTTTLILGPLVASLDIPVAKMSGRGLGHTGGTVDKFETIPGFHVEVPIEQFIRQVNDQKLALVGQSSNLAPADKMLYALRDVTGSVSSIPLIASSIMSKKIAAGADAIVLDVKTGAGALMKKPEEALILAKTMVDIGHSVGKQTVAILSDMSQPLGFAIGNALEIKEAIDVLLGKGPEDLQELVFVLGSQMVLLAGKASDEEKAREMLQAAIKDGRAICKLKQLIESQGGNSRVIDHPELLPTAKYQILLPAKRSGVVAKIIADQVGLIAMQLGAGRATKEDIIDPAVGIVLHKKVGDKVNAGDALLTIHSNRENNSTIIDGLYNAISITDTATIPILIQNIIRR